MAQPKSNTAIQNCLQWISDNCEYGVRDPNSDERCVFIPRSQILAYFNEARLNEVLSAIIGDDEHYPRIGGLVLARYICVFCILLEIGQGKFIQHFVRYHLSDDRLPFDSGSPPAHFPSLPLVNPNFLSLFCERQWNFCVPDFHYPLIGVEYEQRRILPLLQKERLQTTENAATYKVVLLDSANKLVPEHALVSQPFLDFIYNC
jgi:hypothetical protein